MSKPVQKRSQATRAKLIEAAEKAIASKGYGAMRVEDVVHEAGVAKGTFFAHFQDKDVLMDLLIGQEIETYLDAFEEMAPPDSVDELVKRLMPLMNFMSSERYVFDVILRHSGAAAKEEIGPIARTFEHQVVIFIRWLTEKPFRKDVSPLILAEGIQAFAVQCIGLQFCAINREEPMHSRLTQYLNAWLSP
ncbi:TetR/AcrR family transcriptional regulator [Sulfitobacter geojensis]|uniref:TetR/AcrR family transcriptional regulator n=1 Tax=Sulfitobacter geojensis TaxID=1342299 RepID=UPI000468FB9A|nr:TetR/AcrR family transcriptional regulator [Sulfitobacter geojensis]KHA52536.1 Transcriptional regulator, TetR family [Sulfitobacter geojensis]NYI28786.1 AcrR family transcriptional regulator [Sulfitobacter geojensis]